MKKKVASRKIPAKRRRRSSLVNLYSRNFVASPSAIRENSGESLEQPSPYKYVPSTVTYGVIQPPLLQW